MNRSFGGSRNSSSSKSSVILNTVSHARSRLALCYEFRIADFPFEISDLTYLVLLYGVIVWAAFVALHTSDKPHSVSGLRT